MAEIPFGKYKGENIKDVPEDYLRWLYDEIEEEIAKKQWLLDRIEDELNNR